MPVAKTYIKWTQICEPFEKNKRMYVNVRKPDSMAEKTVRWYSDKEWSKMYAAEPVSTSAWTKPQKSVLGFSKGYITIFKEGMDMDNEYFAKSPARYAEWWGWYFTSDKELPADIPIEYTPIQLDWSMVGLASGNLRPAAEVKQIVDNLRYGANESQFQGKVGDRIERVLTVIKAIHFDGQYGSSTLHVMLDSSNNIYTWTTATKTWPVGSTKHIKGTVKTHQAYGDPAANQTVLTRCTEILS